MKKTNTIVAETQIKFLSGAEIEQRARAYNPLSDNVLAQPDEIWAHPSGSFHLEPLPAFQRRRRKRVAQ